MSLGLVWLENRTTWPIYPAGTDMGYHCGQYIRARMSDALILSLTLA